MKFCMQCAHWKKRKMPKTIADLFDKRFKGATSVWECCGFLRGVWRTAV